MYADRVFEPGPNRIFTFGSNQGGRHGKGAALEARLKYGAIYGVAEGLMLTVPGGVGCYAIPTKDQYLTVLALAQIKPSVDRFLLFARANLDLTFFVTRIGTGLSGLRDQDMLVMFKGYSVNCVMPIGWE